MLQPAFPRVAAHLPRIARTALLVLTFGVSLVVPAVAQEADAPATVEDFVQPQVQQGMSQRQLYCMQMERRLQREARGAQHVRDALPKIDQEISRTNRQYQQAQNQAESLDCYDYFLFSKDWRNTPRCNKVRQTIDSAKRKIEQLRAQRDRASDGQEEQTRQDALITELARNGCGPQYVREAQRRSSHGNFFWNDSEGDPGFGATTIPEPTYTTYRTLCVRTCDGYFYPISFAATQSGLQRDADQCQSQCAAPARLFIYQNPGAEMEQAVSVDGGVAYSRIPNAFRYRRELVKGCSCKEAEYVPQDGDVGATASIKPAPGGPAGDIEAAPLAEAGAETVTAAQDGASALFQGDEPAEAAVAKPKPRKRVRVASPPQSVDDLPRHMQ